MRISTISLPPDIVCLYLKTDCIGSDRFRTYSMRICKMRQTTPCISPTKRLKSQYICKITDILSCQQKICVYDCQHSGKDEPDNKKLLHEREIPLQSDHCKITVSAIIADMIASRGRFLMLHSLFRLFLYPHALEITAATPTEQKIPFHPPASGHSNY